MQHPDEGTIHTWLDGELAPSAATALETHITVCAKCAAAVAGARGLVAASTRILSVLDDVQADVIPATPDPKVVPLPVAAPKQSRRPFYRHPQFGAAAAVLVLAVGTWTMLQRAPSRDAVAPVSALDVSAERMDSAALGKAGAGAVAVRDATPAVAPVNEPSTRPPAATAVAPRPAAKEMKAREARDERTEADARRDNAGNAAGMRQALAAAAPPVDTVRVASPPASDLALLARARTDSARTVPPAAAPSPLVARSADAIVANERRRVLGDVTAQRASLENVVVTGAASTMRKSTAAAVLCYAVERSPLALQLNVPERIALHPDQGVEVGGQEWRVVRVPQSGDKTPWSWLMGDAATVYLARVEGTPPVVRQQVALSPGGSATTLRATLVNCATR